MLYIRKGGNYATELLVPPLLIKLILSHNSRDSSKSLPAKFWHCCAQQNIENTWGASVRIYAAAQRRPPETGDRTAMEIGFVLVVGDRATASSTTGVQDTARDRHQYHVTSVKVMSGQATTRLGVPCSEARRQGTCRTSAWDPPVACLRDPSPRSPHGSRVMRSERQAGAVV
jgi:hypothetical protein